VVLSGKYIFRKDDDGHWYFFPVEFVDEFNEWLNFMELKWGQAQYDLEWEGTSFEHYLSVSPETYVILDWESHEKPS